MNKGLSKILELGFFVGSFFFIWYITGEKIFKRKKKIVKENILLILRNLCYEIYTVLCETSKTTKHVYDMLKNESNTTIELSRLEEVLLNNGYKKKIEDVEKNVLKRFNVSVEDFYEELKNYEKDPDVQKYLNSIKKMYNEALLGLQPKLPSIDEKISEDVIINLTSLIYKEKRKIYKTKIDSMLKNNEIIDIQNTLSNAQFFENLHKSTQHVEEQIIKENNNLVPNLFTFKYLVSYYSNDPNFLQKKKYLESKHGEKMIKILKIKTSKKKKKRAHKEDRQSSNSSVSFKSTPSLDVYNVPHLGTLEKEEDHYSQQSKEMEHMDKDSHVDFIPHNVDANLDKRDEQIEYISESGDMQPEKEYYEGEHITIRYEEEEDISEIYEEDRASRIYEEDRASGIYEEEHASGIYEEEHASGIYEEDHEERYRTSQVSERSIKKSVTSQQDDIIHSHEEDNYVSDREVIHDDSFEFKQDESFVGDKDQNFDDDYVSEREDIKQDDDYISERDEIKQDDSFAGDKDQNFEDDNYVSEKEEIIYDNNNISDREQVIQDDNYVSDKEEIIYDNNNNNNISDSEVDKENNNYVYENDEIIKDNKSMNEKDSSIHYDEEGTIKNKDIIENVKEENSDIQMLENDIINNINNEIIDNNENEIINNQSKVENNTSMTEYEDVIDMDYKSPENLFMFDQEYNINEDHKGEINNNDNDNSKSVSGMGEREVNDEHNTDDIKDDEHNADDIKDEDNDQVEDNQELNENLEGSDVPKDDEALNIEDTSEEQKETDDKIESGSVRDKKNEGSTEKKIETKKGGLLMGIMKRKRFMSRDPKKKS
ncbi:hypothetical protein PFNF135_04202 [Plasmodium falciparum NF135/5.C10]|uniref:Uncharacterized protein n=1 Tax=Plasmodium falciparum NF135/5.C10 TaxID=1036726 RepID=W4IEI8_PLAFA|nr:hypothetical protein PFNF135_04202 [Plasmodium falciparum NF135/5.C10]